MTNKRATTTAEFESLMAKFFSESGVATGLAVQLRPTDVVISPFAKCGTTWIQQIVHTLRTQGDDDYDDISRVVPWIETASDLGIDLNAEQKAPPRAFKSHLPWDLVPKGGKYIVSIRDPKDALVSMYRFMEGWFIEPGTINMTDLAHHNFTKRGELKDYWHHLRSWLGQRDNSSVLVLAYERMSEDPSATISHVAEFIGVELNEQLMAIAEVYSSLDYMQSNKNKFDDLLMRTRSEEIVGLPPGGDSAKVREGKVGSHRHELSDQLIAELDDIWAEEITGTLGYPDYRALLDTFA